MQIRPLCPDDLPHASALCLSAFTQAVAPTLSAEGVTTFSGLATAQAFRERLRGDNVMLACVAEDELVGLVELKEGRHIAMLFVAPAWQRRGVGARLINAALTHARTDVVTVKASLNAVAAYQRFGFALAGNTGEFAGLVYQPMERRRHA
ncbi:GNAT family N-acetyltransferase [Pseudomonas sp. NBRC 111119]|uniref:GNAT family N-acetyltransferase n=1 Tax=Pseudomonas sp. NBRC 111119 TaxID=1661034 RepID=UPI0007619992|nr:GNAT family N-acetyltransferase [Pseudomonas sp. NBRC 111119]